MINNVFGNNQVIIIGEITKQPAFSHEIYGEGIYLCEVAVERISDCEDIIQVMISNRSLDMKEDYVGSKVEIQGQFRSHNHQEGNKSRLVLYVFAREINFINMIQPSTITNSIILDGYICKPPIYRKTPLGREIADIIVAVNRPYGKSDYIPCICWGRNARYVQTIEVGSRVEIMGRIQSQRYKKKISKSEIENRTAYEISVMSLNLI